MVTYEEEQIQTFLNLAEDNGTAMFFIAEKQQKTILNFLLDWLIVTEWYKSLKFENINFIEWSNRF